MNCPVLLLTSAFGISCEAETGPCIMLILAIGGRGRSTLLGDAIQVRNDVMVALKLLPPPIISSILWKRFATASLDLTSKRSLQDQLQSNPTCQTLHKKVVPFLLNIRDEWRHHQAITSIEKALLDMPVQVHNATHWLQIRDSMYFTKGLKVQHVKVCMYLYDWYVFICCLPMKMRHMHALTYSYVSFVHICTHYNFI